MHALLDDFYVASCFWSTWTYWAYRGVGWFSCWASEWSDCLLPSLFSELHPLLLPALLVPDDGVNANDGDGPTHDYESKHEPKRLSIAVTVSDELLCSTMVHAHSAVVPTDLNVRILVDCCGGPVNLAPNPDSLLIRCGDPAVAVRRGPSNGTKAVLQLGHLSKPSQNW